MRSFAVASALLAGVNAFQTNPLSSARASLVTVNQYIPDGFTADSYKKFKEEEKKKLAKQNLGGVGPRGFKSRSMQSFQEAMERGEASHLLPVFNAKEKLKSGELKKEDIPYMQRGGAWDNSDVKGAKKKSWLASDKEYANGGFKKEQSISIFGYGEGLDWTGARSKTGPVTGPKFDKNYKPPNVNTMKGVKKSPEVQGWKTAEPEEKKKKGGFFGMF